MDIRETIAAHENVALQVSMGRDSLACLYVLRDLGLLDKVTVYWVNSGRAFPETLEIADHVRSMAPRFVEIAGNQPEVIRQWGIPTDILPRSCTPIGVMCGKSDVRMQDTYSCCGRVIMGPLHERMISDGVTLIIRGQRADDSHKAPVVSGDWENGIQYLFPIEGWTGDDVSAFLNEVGAPRSRSYDFMDSTPDCMDCSGWWGENRGEFLRAHHPEAYTEFLRRLDLIRVANADLIQMFNLDFGGSYE